MVQSMTSSSNSRRDSQISRERKFRRLRLRYPVHLKIESPDTECELDAMSHDVSIGGLLLETSFVIPDHSRVSFIMKITDDQLVRPVELEGNGEIVRVESRADQKFRIAVACKGSIRYRKIVRKHPPGSPKSNADHNSLMFVKAERSAGCKVDCLTWFASPTIVPMRKSGRQRKPKGPAEVRSKARSNNQKRPLYGSKSIGRPLEIPTTTSSLRR